MRIVEFKFDVGNAVQLVKSKDCKGMVWELVFNNGYVMYGVRTQSWGKVHRELYLESELEPAVEAEAKPETEGNGGKD